jgi:dedicator of cytokinesis protein 6/7/8
VRKAVQSDQVITASNSFCSSSISLNDLVDSLDFEDFLVQKSQNFTKDPLRNILEFPTNDVIVLSTPRKIRTEKYVLPEEYERNQEEIPIQIYNCIKAFTKPWKHVKFSCRDEVLRERYERKIDPLSYHHQEYEIDSSVSFSTSMEESTLMVGSCSSLTSSTHTEATLTPSCRGSWISGVDMEEINLRSVASDALLPILDRTPSEHADIQNECNRIRTRMRDMFSLQQIDDSDEFIERRMPAEVPMEHMGHRIVVKFLQLRFEIEIEPIFCIAAIYDAKEKKKISENFYFDMNADQIKSMLSSHVPYSDSSTLSRSAIFEITHPSNDLYLVVRFEKVLQGDIKDSIEPYLKEFTNIEKAKSNALDYTERLGKYRAPFAFTAVHLNSIFKGENVDGERDRESVQSQSSNSLDRKSSTSSFDQFKKRATETVSTTLSRRGSLERRESQSRRSWSPIEDFANFVENFKTISVTVSSIFKQEPEKMKDEDLFKFLPELKRMGTQTLKKYKFLPGKCY